MKKNMKKNMSWQAYFITSAINVEKLIAFLVVKDRMMRRIIRDHLMSM